MDLEKYPDWRVWDAMLRKRASAYLAISVDFVFFIFDPVSTKYISVKVSNK